VAAKVVQAPLVLIVDIQQGLMVKLVVPSVDVIRTNDPMKTVLNLFSERCRAHQSIIQRKRIQLRGIMRARRGRAEKQRAVGNIVRDGSHLFGIIRRKNAVRYTVADKALSSRPVDQRKVRQTASDDLRYRAVLVAWQRAGDPAGLQAAGITIIRVVKCIIVHREKPRTPV
jgi:hypothetical protein